MRKDFKHRKRSQTKVNDVKERKGTILYDKVKIKMDKIILKVDEHEMTILKNH